jgi:hypothetical protein
MCDADHCDHSSCCDGFVLVFVFLDKHSLRRRYSILFEIFSSRRLCFPSKEDSVVLTVAEALAWYLIHLYACMTNETTLDEFSFST